MNEQQTMLSDMANGLFAELGSLTSLAQTWPQIEELGLASLLLGEADGGFGGSWQDALIVFRLAGYHALAAPVVEAIVAASIGEAKGFSGRGTIATTCTGTVADRKFTGCLDAVVQGTGAAYAVAPLGEGCVVVDLAEARPTGRATVSGEERTAFSVESAKAVIGDESVFALGAFARSAQIAGALDAALAMAVGYVNERKQFGKPLAKFQAVQQNLASFACEAAAANCAAVGAAQALDRHNADFEIAAAKIRSNQAAGIGAAIAHQAHGAIGFTEEYGLHPLTRRLWSWRSEFGGDRYWADKLGSQVMARGADRFWPDLTALTG